MARKTNSRERDSQKARFFKAVAVLYKFGTPLKSMKDVYEFVHAPNGKAMDDAYGDAIDFKVWYLGIKDGRGHGRATCSPSEGWVSFPKHERTTAWVVRMLAYNIAGRMSRFSNVRAPGNKLIRWGNKRAAMARKYGEPSIAWHGWRYCMVLLDLVRYKMGEKAYEALKASFDANNVSYAVPIKRPTSDDKKDAKIERGKILGALMKDRARRKKFLKDYPEAVVVSVDAFDDVWETLYQVYK